MTSQFFQTELSNLIQESKRKNSDLRNAAEQCLIDLKALPSTSETQFTADLFRRPNFANPFILACHTRHTRLGGIGVVGLQRLVASQALPPERLKDALKGLRETISLGLDVQLKILQTLPAFLQNYSEELNDELLGSTLEICATLQLSKTDVVANTAAATLQQLVISSFEKVSEEDDKPQSSVSVATVTIGNHQAEVGLAAYDALRVLDDFCRLIEGEKLGFLQIKNLSPVFVLELIESILASSVQTFASHKELIQLLRDRLMPLIMRYLAEKHSFPQMVRVARLLLILFKDYMALVTEECEMALGLLTHLLEPDATSPWKRALFMEVFRGLFAEPAIIRLIYTTFDGVEERKDILKDHMTALVRLTSENPNLIGVRHQSTVPFGVTHSQTTTEDQITLEVGGVAGVIGTAATSTDTNVLGIGSQWSTVRTPYLELLDKTNAPVPPETYIYSLVLNCISSLSEGLAKFILPLTVLNVKSRRRYRAAAPDPALIPDVAPEELQRADTRNIHGSIPKQSAILINPLDLGDHPQLPGIKACAGILETCWPAILATCSTFLYAALDNDFYHSLVRSFQKLTHVAGLLRLSTPRDAFLTTLGKSSLPVDGGSIASPRTAVSPGSDLQHTNHLENTIIPAESSTAASQISADTPKTFFENIRASLSTRNLLCLRALLNLGIALGPTLSQHSWAIILETLQNSDLVIGVSAAQPKQSVNLSSDGESTMASGAEVPRANLSTEIAAVQAASCKMIERTVDYPDSSFEAILEALLSLPRSAGYTQQLEGVTNSMPSTTLLPLQSLQTPRRMGRIHQNTRGIPLVMGRSRLLDDELKFVLEKTSDLAKSNLERLSGIDIGGNTAWNILMTKLIPIIISREISPSIRLKGSKVLNDIVFRTMKFGNLGDGATRNHLQLRNLRALKMQVIPLYESQSDTLASSHVANIDIHEEVLDTLKSLLEQHGESLVAGWDSVFDLISSVFEGQRPSKEVEAQDSIIIRGRAKSRQPISKSPRLIRAAYKSLQLVASDFLPILPSEYLLDLVYSFSDFALQDQDFNISLTTTTFFWNVSDFLRGQIERFSIESHINASASEETLCALAKDDDKLISRSALWLSLLLRIVDLTTDARPEIRLSAIRTLLRIFDAYGQQLSPKAWHLCLNRVLFVMVERVQAKVLSVNNIGTPIDSDEVSQWVETAVIVVRGCSDLMATFFDPIIRDKTFGGSWNRLLWCFKALIQVNRYEFSEAIFSSLSTILARVQIPSILDKEAIWSAWSLWAGGHPTLDKGSLNIDRPNQDALLAYLRSFKHIYHLLDHDLVEEQIEQVLRYMKYAVWDSVISPYSIDIDHQLTLQALVNDYVKIISSDMVASQPAIVSCLADFSDSALTQWSTDRDRRRPTLVAFSKQSMDSLSWYVADAGIKVDVFATGSLTTALSHLAHPILQKYAWRGKDSETTLWQTATTASLKILRATIPLMEGLCEKSTQQEIWQFWKCVLDIGRGIISANGYPEFDIRSETLRCDETFDIDAFRQFISLVVPSLGRASIPDQLRRNFFCTVFQASLIYPLQQFDLASAIEKEPLRDLYEIRRGRTYDPPVTARSNIAYVLADTMFELAAAAGTNRQEEDSYARVSLARSISPYLILRCSIPLKSYITDQPLRGLMPQPTCARKELIHFLDRIADLRSEPKAIPEAPIFAGTKPALSSRATSSATSLTSHSRSTMNSSLRPLLQTREPYKKHLGWLYPLVVKAIQVAGREREDGKVLDALVKVLDEVGSQNDISTSNQFDTEDEGGEEGEE